MANIDLKREDRVGGPHPAASSFASRSAKLLEISHPMNAILCRAATLSSSGSLFLDMDGTVADFGSSAADVPGMIEHLEWLAKRGTPLIFISSNAPTQMTNRLVTPLREACGENGWLLNSCRFWASPAENIFQRLDPLNGTVHEEIVGTKAHIVERQALHSRRPLSASIFIGDEFGRGGSDASLISLPALCNVNVSEPDSKSIVSTHHCFSGPSGTSQWLQKFRLISLATETLASRANEVINELNNEGIRHVVVSGASAVVSGSILAAAAQAQGLTFNLCGFDATLNVALYKDEGVLLQHSRRHLLREAVAKQLNITSVEIPTVRLAVVDEYINSGAKRSNLPARLVSQIGFPSVTFKALVRSNLCDGPEVAQPEVYAFAHSLSRECSLAIHAHGELSRSSWSTGTSGRFSDALLENARKHIINIAAATGHARTLGQLDTEWKALESVPSVIPSRQYGFDVLLDELFRPDGSYRGDT